MKALCNLIRWHRISTAVMLVLAAAMLLTPLLAAETVFVPSAAVPGAGAFADSSAPSLKRTLQITLLPFGSSLLPSLIKNGSTWQPAFLFPAFAVYASADSGALGFAVGAMFSRLQVSPAAGIFIYISSLKGGFFPNVSFPLNGRAVAPAVSFVFVTSRPVPWSDISPSILPSPISLLKSRRPPPINYKGSGCSSCSVVGFASPEKSNPNVAPVQNAAEQAGGH